MTAKRGRGSYIISLIALQRRYRGSWTLVIRITHNMTGNNTYIKEQKNLYLSKWDFSSKMNLTTTIKFMAIFLKGFEPRNKNDIMVYEKGTVVMGCSSRNC